MKDDIKDLKVDVNRQIDRLVDDTKEIRADIKDLQGDIKEIRSEQFKIIASFSAGN